MTGYIRSGEAMIRHQKFHLACRESPTVVLSDHIKN